MHNWSYGHQTSMNLNFLERLLNYLKHCLLSSQGDSTINKVNQAQWSTSVQTWIDSAIQLHKLITGDLDHQKV